jgi:hypothetical protein
MCTVLLPPGVNTIAVNKYINIKLLYLNIRVYNFPFYIYDNYSLIIANLRSRNM